MEGEKSFQKRITFSSPVGEKFPKTDNFLQDMWLKITPK
jgi:hypothetical protein